MGLNLESVISLNASGFERGMDHAKTSVIDLVKTFAIGAIGVTTVEQAFERTTETAKELVNQASRLGITVEQVQILKQAAKDAGTEFDAVATALEKINQLRAKALGGDKKALAAFGALGVSKKDLETKSASDLFENNIGNKVKSTNPEEIAGPLKEVLGKGAGQVIGVLKTDFDELGDKMKKSGAIMDTNVAVKLKAMADEFEFVSKIIITQLAPALAAFAEWAYKIILKGAGTVAKTAAEAGSVYGQTGSLSKFIGLVAKTDINSFGKMLGFKGRDQADINKEFGVSGKEVKKAGEDAEEPWKKALEDFQAEIKKQQDSLNNPIKPNFDNTEKEAKKEAKANKEVHQPRETDALVKVGNFLGASKGVIGNAQTIMIQHAAATATNTKRTADALDKIKIELATPKPDPKKFGFNTEIQWPSN